MSILELPNGRDLAGIPCTGGVIRRGLLMRSAAPNTPEQSSAIQAMGVTHVVDLRTRQERAQQATALPDGVESVVEDVLADATYAGAANLGKMASEALSGAQNTPGFEGHDLRAIMVDSYRDFARLPSAQRAARRTVELLADPATGPVILHCTAGKDRTGWLVAVILRSLGASWSDIEQDYLASGPAVNELFADYLAALPAKYNNSEALAPVLGVFPDYLGAAREWAESHYPSFEAYVAQGLEVSDQTLDALRVKLVQASSDSTLT